MLVVVEVVEAGTLVVVSDVLVVVEDVLVVLDDDVLVVVEDVLVVLDDDVDVLMLVVVVVDSEVHEHVSAVVTHSWPGGHMPPPHIGGDCVAHGGAQLHAAVGSNCPQRSLGRAHSRPTHMVSPGGFPHSSATGLQAQLPSPRARQISVGPHWPPQMGGVCPVSSAHGIVVLDVEVVEVVLLDVLEVLDVEVVVLDEVVGGTEVVVVGTVGCLHRMSISMSVVSVSSTPRSEPPKNGTSSGNSRFGRSTVTCARNESNPSWAHR